ncbi:MAG: class I SAM-dependent methyltransferase [Epsilonproteobacteria bacterium]|nr:MAG: class I SAM-dependent methyltransferase [Campylobacterota bacterium]
MKILSNKKFYEQSVAEFGISAQGVHWNNKYTQYKRFEIITKCIKKDIKNSTLVDVGCGFGEYYNYLQNNHKVPTKFIGLDCEQNMINICRKRFPSLEFYTKDILKDELIDADYYTCSGALNILTLDEINIFIKKCFHASRKGFIFNFLKNLTFSNIKKYEIINICEQYTQSIIVKEGYLDNDFTIFMIKP